MSRQRTPLKTDLPKTDLSILSNVGPAMLRDFEVLGIQNQAQLAKQNADALYHRLTELTGWQHDPCVWDVFRAAIHEAQTGEKTKWWAWTPERKARQKQGTF